MEDLAARLKQLASDALSADKTLREAVAIKKEVEAALKEAKVALAVSRVAEADKAYTDSLTAMKEAAPVLYKNAVRDAVAKSAEYAFDAFLIPLLSVGDEPSLYEIETVGVGWARTVVVHLKMDEIAGDIEQYARGVESAREILKVKDTRDPDKASKIWRTKIYGKGPYTKTIKMRLVEAGGKAPFWSLLNDGSKNVSMSSDIGGTPYPSRGGRHFVERAEDQIKSYFLVNFQLAKFNYKRGIEFVEEAISEAQYTLRRLEEETNSMSENSDLITKIAREIGVTTKELSASKIITAVEKIRRGEPMAAQIRVGASGDKRIRLGRFIQLTNEFGD